MRLVLSGYYGFNNIGDEAILASIIQSLHELDPNIEIIVLSNNPEFTKATYGVGAVNRWKLKDVFFTLLKSDGLISGGGSLLQDKTGKKSVPYYSGVMMLARLLRKPVFMFAQGIGPLQQNTSRRIVRMTLNRLNGITVRDEESKQLLRDIGIKKKVGVVPDPVMGYKRNKVESDWLNKGQGTRPFVTVSVRNWNGQVTFKKKVAEALDHLIEEENIDVIFVPMHDWHDHNSSVEVAKMMENAVKIAPYDASIDEKISIIESSEFLLGMRLHSLIFAGTVGTPFVALSYDPKIDAFAQQCDQPVAGHVDYDSLEDLAENLLVSYRKRDELKIELNEKVNGLKKNALMTAKQALFTISKKKTREGYHA